MVRGGAFTLMGSIISAVMGLVFIIVVGRTLGTTGAGTVFQGIAAFTIVLSIAKLGLDTTAVWLLPRLVDQDPVAVRPALLGMLVPALLIGGLGAAALRLGAEHLTDQEPLVSALEVMSWALPAATIATVGMAATRALGGVRTFVMVGSIGIPTVRPLLAWLATALGGTGVAVAVSWTLPFPVAAVVVLLVLLHQISRRLAAREGRAWWPSSGLIRRTFSFALPRAVSTGLEQVVTWLDVLVVGMLAGPAAAGIYGAASRFVTAGMMLASSLRIVVAPMYSRHLGAGRREQAQHLYTVTTMWIVLFSVPFYLLLALYGGSVLSILGPNFRAGAAALAVLAVGMGLVQAAGNIQSVLLMSGHSALAAINKAIAVVVNVGLLFILVPRAGLVGAALAWTVAMAVDTLLALGQVRLRVGLRPFGRRIAAAMAVALVPVAVPGGGLRAAMGDTPLALVLSILLGGALLSAVAWRMRVTFDLNALAAMARSRTGR